MAAYKEATRKSDAYRKDSEPKKLNHDKPKSGKVDTSSRKPLDKQC